MKTKALYLTIALATMLGFSSCNLNFFPDDELNAEVLLQNAKGAKTVMNGCYALLKDEIEYQGYASGNTYVRHYFQMSEYPSDNICLSAHTTDPLYEATAYMMTDQLKNVGTLWMLAYKVIYMTNCVIEKLPETEAENKQMLGEAYFMRGLMHLHLVTLYAQPYSYGQNNAGIPLRTSASSDKTIRNSVGDVYEQIAADFRKAADLMGKSRGNAGYPCHDAALGLLSRVYLYMGKYDECIATVDEALNGATPESKLEQGAAYANYFANAKDSKETLFCLGHIASDNRGQSSIGSMYLKDGIGWGEVYPSDPLMYLYERYPSDLRYNSFIVPQFVDKTATKPSMVYVTVPAAEGGEAPHIKAKFKLEDDGAGNYSFTESGTKYSIEARKINGEGKEDAAGEYVEYHVKNFRGEADCLCRINKEVTLRTGYTIPMVFVNKFSYQDGDPMLSSPVFCRWAEVILNRAEAYAHKGDAKALEDVNVIRTRAGIPTEGMFDASKMHGYDNLLDIVLDERRMELAFEGHRHFDMCRNKKSMDRRYAGAQPFKVIDPTSEPHIIYPIPNDEWTVSHIDQNPGY